MNYIVEEKIAIIGIGRLGKSLARALCEVGCDVISLTDQESAKAIACAKKCGDSTQNYKLEKLPQNVTMIILTIPDDFIQSMAEKISDLKFVDDKTVVFHTSGVASTRALKALEKRTHLLASMHPVQTFSGAEDDWKRLYGIYFGLEGNKLALARIKAVIARLKGHSFIIQEQNKSLYHLACVFASNYLISVISVATQILGKIDISEKEAIKILGPLVFASADNIQQKGVALSATGPVTRGDVGTLINHLENIQSTVPEFLDVYNELGKILIKLMQHNNTLSKDQIDRMKKVLVQQNR
jgi:predicted short-subunit dehydrogenase-like oxidoreductase (DUF2520 family)